MFFANRHIQIFKFKNLIYIECWRRKRLILTYMYIHIYVTKWRIIEKKVKVGWL